MKRNNSFIREIPSIIIMYCNDIIVYNFFEIFLLRWWNCLISTIHNDHNFSNDSQASPLESFFFFFLFFFLKLGGQNGIPLLAEVNTEKKYELSICIIYKDIGASTKQVPPWKFHKQNARLHNGNSNWKYTNWFQKYLENMPAHVKNYLRYKIHTNSIYKNKNGKIKEYKNGEGLPTEKIHKIKLKVCWWNSPSI